MSAKHIIIARLLNDIDEPLQYLKQLALSLQNVKNRGKYSLPLQRAEIGVKIHFNPFSNAFFILQERERYCYKYSTGLLAVRPRCS